MSKKTEKVVNATFLIAIIAVVVFSFLDIALVKWQEKAEAQPTTVPTTAGTTECIIETEPTEQTEANQPVTLYDVPLDEELQIHIIETAQAKGIDPSIIFAMARRESNYRLDVIGDSGKSYGLLQIQPKWHYKRMVKLGCTDLLDPYQNVTVGIDYLAELLERYGSIDKALTAYNKGHYSGTITKYAKAVKSMAKGIDTYVVYR